MKGNLNLKGCTRVSSFNLEIDVQCQSFEEVEKTLSWVESLKMQYKPEKERPRSARKGVGS